MSGGAFDYYQYKIDDIITVILSEIKRNADRDKEATEIKLNEFGDRAYSIYSKKTIERFKEAVISLRIAKIKANRIDWLLSGDDGEEEFHEQWDEEIAQVIKQKNPHFFE